MIDLHIISQLLGHILSFQCINLKRTNLIWMLLLWNRFNTNLVFCFSCRTTDRRCSIRGNGHSWRSRGRRSKSSKFCRRIVKLSTQPILSTHSQTVEIKPILSTHSQTVDMGDYVDSRRQTFDWSDMISDIFYFF